MKTKLISVEEPYGELICKHISTQFPSVSTFNSNDLVDILSTLIIGTKEVRYGSLPTPESLVVIRNVIREAISNNTAIPILVPWGSIKSNFSATLDIAELSAIQRLVCLCENVKRYYFKGLEIVIRVEDTSGYTLFSLENNSLTNSNIDSYSRDFKNLVSILCPTGDIRVILESEMVNAGAFEADNIVYSNMILRYLLDSMELIKFAPDKVYGLDSYKLLFVSGWKGIIPQEQRDHYLQTYARLYPNLKEEQYLERLSLYFGGAFARAKLGMTGKQSYWTSSLQLVFVPPVKGTPVGYTDHYVYYRTLSLNQARTHMPAWRAKGYLRIVGNTITHKLTTFSDSDLIDKLTPVQLEVYNDNLSVTINTDYLLED